MPTVYNEIEGRITPQSVQVIDNKIVSGFSEITKYPSKHWAENIGFELQSISIADTGVGYLDAPVMRVMQADTPFAFSKVLIEEALPSVKKIVDAVKSSLYVS